MIELSPEPRIVVRFCQTDADRDAAMTIRFRVFVDEQNVPAELEADAYDAVALHLLAIDTQTGDAIGTARLLDKGEGALKIGRVATLAEHRGRGVGRRLMEYALREAAERGFVLAFLDAQLPVIPFYENLGFVAEGSVFSDAGIDHRRMTRKIRPIS